MGVFIISPLPPLLSKELRTAGPLRSPGITPSPRYYGPLRHPLVVSRLPGATGYTAYPASALAVQAGRPGPTGMPQGPSGQKVTGYSFRAGVNGGGNEAVQEWLKNAVTAGLLPEKVGEVSTGSGN